MSAMTTPLVGVGGGGGEGGGDGGDNESSLPVDPNWSTSDGQWLGNDTGWLYSLLEAGLNASGGLNASADLNETQAEEDVASSLDTAQVVAMAVTSTILGIMILATVIGNVFVIAAILLERNLQNVANYLILSLAVADLMVACLVMPLGAVAEVSQQWILGPELCDMWTSCDVLCCTASILHLVAIAVDRFWAVTQVDYIHQRNSRRIGIMILIVWIVSFIVSLAPMFGWKDPDFLNRVHEQKKCLISQDVAYQVFATFATFYVPLTVILLLYWRIFQAARKRIRRKVGTNARTLVAASKGSKKEPQRKNLTAPNETTAFTTVSSSNTSPEKSSSTNGSTSQTSHMSDMSRMEMLPKKDKAVKHKESVESKREKKAAKTLAIITGAFIFCWLPFFVTALLMPICESCYFPDIMISLFLWLGYFNSTLNPIIYTIFSPEFRNAFKRILLGKNSRHYRQKR